MAEDRKQPGPKDHAMGTGGPGPERRDGKGDQQATPDTTGTTGLGSGATGRPGYADGGQAPPQPVEPTPGDRARGVTEQRVTPVVSGGNTAAREAGALGSAGEGSTEGGAHGSGSTVAGPGTTGRADQRGTVGGTSGEGVGGPVPAPGPIADSPARGATPGRTRIPDSGRGQEAEDRKTARKSLDDGQS